MGEVEFSKLVNLDSLNSQQLCKNCKFWKTISNRSIKDGTEYPILGECRIRAPIAANGAVSSNNALAYFPKVSPFWWCGEYVELDQSVEVISVGKVIVADQSSTVAPAP